MDINLTKDFPGYTHILRRGAMGHFIHIFNAENERVMIAQVSSATMKHSQFLFDMYEERMDDAPEQNG